MGFFHSIWFKNSKGEEVEIQFKAAGEYDPQTFEVGDKISISNGIYFGFEGCFVVVNEIIIAAFDESEKNLFTKWGHIIPFPDLSECNPITAAVKKLNSEPNVQASVATEDDSSNAAGTIN